MQSFFIDCVILSSDMAFKKDIVQPDETCLLGKD